MKRIPSLLLFVALLAALAALYNGFAEKDLDKEAAMTSFKEAERFGEMADDKSIMQNAPLFKMEWYEKVRNKNFSTHSFSTNYFYIQQKKFG